MQSRKDREKTLIIIIAIVFITGLGTNTLSADIRGLWVMAWDLTSPEKIDGVVEFALDHNINQLFVHCRYRSDALYRPNRIYDTYPNPEPRSYILADSDFDPLAYMIEVTAGTELEVHAWVTVFIATPRTLEHLSPKHLYYTRNDWLTKDFLGNQMPYDAYEGAYLDPGIPEVQDYLINVFLDIVNNYPVAGIQLDYIRYPDNQFGHNELALAQYSTSLIDHLDFHKWKEHQISRFVRRFYSEVKYHNPDLIVSAAVISNLERATQRYSQNWMQWLDDGYLDYAYTMTYSPSDEIVAKELQLVRRLRERIIVGLRAWTEEQRPYSPESVSSKISIAKRLGFPGIALFSYSGVKTNNSPNLRRSLAGQITEARSFRNSLIFGRVTNYQNNPLARAPVYLNDGERFTLADENGFFFFNNLEPGEYWLKSDKGINVIFSSNITIPPSNNVYSIKYDLHFPELYEFE